MLRETAKRTLYAREGCHTQNSLKTTTKQHKITKRELRNEEKQ